MNTTKSTNVIQLNVSAPKFKLLDVFDREIDLESYRGKKVFLGFFRHAGCPFCNLRIHKLSKIHRELQGKGLEMIFFFESPKSIILNSIFHKEVSPIPTISDPEKIWYSKYALEEAPTKRDAKFMASFLTAYIRAKISAVPIGFPTENESMDTLPAEFLLDEDLVIRKLYYSKSMVDRMEIKHLYDFAEEKPKVLA